MKSMHAMYAGKTLWICFGRRPPNCDVVACILCVGRNFSRAIQKLIGWGDEMKMPIEVYWKLWPLRTLSYGNGSQGFSGSFDRFELSATGMHPKAFPESFCQLSNYSVAGSAMQDCRGLCSLPVVIKFC